MGKKAERKRCDCRWSGWRTPLERRLQTMAVCVMISIFFITIALNVVVLFVPVLWPVYALYVAWFVLFDRRTPLQGGRTPWGRNWSLWKLFRNYFPSVCATG